LDDHTYFLLQEADRKIRHAGFLIEQHRLHMLTVHGARKDAEQDKLNLLIAGYVRLQNYRQALLAEPARAYMQ
jgi:hypothetical protein